MSELAPWAFVWVTPRCPTCKGPLQAPDGMKFGDTTSVTVRCFHCNRLCQARFYTSQAKES